MQNICKLYLVVPCYNEEDALEITSNTLKIKMEALIKKNKITKDSRILFVDDGSKDNTWNLITKFHKEDKMFCGLKLSRNKGSQNALLAGLMFAKNYADATISIEADLQDDIEVIDKMIDEYYKGNEIVYGVRSSRKKDTFLKKVTAGAFYKFMNFIGVETIINHSECRLLSKKALDSLELFNEKIVFLRGIIPQLGYKSSIVYYDRLERVAGKSKFPFKRSMNFALDGITSFSVAPLRFITFLGILMIIISIIMLIIWLILKLKLTYSMIILLNMWLLSGIIVISLGIIAEYIGKMFNEIKNRPRYIIEEELSD